MKEKDMTIKDELEYYAKRGLNPYQFGINIVGSVLANESLKPLFDNKDSELTQELKRAVDDAIFKTMDTQDNIEQGESFKYLWNKFKMYGDSFKKGNKKGMVTKENKDFKVNWNVYKISEEDTLESHSKRWDFVHFVLKYKILHPALWFARRFLSKRLSKEILPTPYNENLLLFDKAYEDAIRQWNLLYLKGLPNQYTAGKSDEWWENRIKYWSANQDLRMGKNALLTLIQTDTAYREFFNILMHNIGRYGKMHYDRVKEAGNGVIRHVFYTSSFAEDVHYMHYYRLTRDPSATKLVETGTVSISDKPKEEPKQTEVQNG